MKKSILFLILLVFCVVQVYSETGIPDNKIKNLKIEEFIETAVKNDAVFEEILIDRLALKYMKDLQLPAKDLILSVKSQYEFSGNSGMSVSLSRLFPYKGTNISAGYELDNDSSQASLLISQPIAKNAFGRVTTLMDKITGVEINVAEHQIVEAYEDYLANIIIVYYRWYSAYENMKIGKSSYEQSLELLDNIKARRKSNIALPIDVNKAKVQSLNKKKSLIGLEERYKNILNIVKAAVRYKGDEELMPDDPFGYNNREISFESDYDNFLKTSRTYNILGLLEDKTSLEVEKYADLLLPSADLLAGYTIDGENAGLKNPDDTLYAGIEVTWPFPGQKEHAQHEISKINRQKTQLSNKNKYEKLHTDLKNLFMQIQREKEFISIAQENILLAEAILKDETKNYTFGKVSLNDFIEAVNLVDENNFSKIQHSVQLKLLSTEWLRMTDQLISKKDIKDIQK